MFIGKSDSGALVAEKHSVIPVLVTGIQLAQVLGPLGLHCAADAALLDPCDKHRDDDVKATYVRLSKST